MTTETAAPAVPEKGLFARAIGVITSPKATYESIVAHPRPLGVMLLVIVITALATAGPQFTDSGRQLVLNNQAQMRERSGQPPPTPEQQATIDRLMQYTPYFTIGGILVAVPFFVMLFSGIYWVLFNAILGGTATFKQVMTVIAHSSIIGAIGAAIGSPIMYAQGKLSNIGPFNLGGLAASADPDSFLRHFLGSVEVFRLWSTVVTAIGLAVLYRRKTGPIATVLLLLYFAITAVMAHFLGRFMA